MKNLYIVISIITLTLIAILFFVSRAKGKRPQKLSTLATLSMFLVIFGIIFGNGDRWLGYSFMGVGVILAVVDIVRNRKKQ